MAKAAHSTTASRRLFLSAGSAAAVFGSLKAASAATGAAGLGASYLAQEFEAAWREEMAINAAYPDTPEMDQAWGVAYTRASAKTRAIVKRIIADPSCDLEALKLKARAYTWCYQGDVDEALGVLSARAESTDDLLIRAILRDLLAIAA